MKRSSRSCQILTPCYLITQISPNHEKRAKSPSEPLKNSRLPDWEMDMVDSITLLQGSSWEFLTGSHQSWHLRTNYQGCQKLTHGQNTWTSLKTYARYGSCNGLYGSCYSSNYKRYGLQALWESSAPNTNIRLCGWFPSGPSLLAPSCLLTGGRCNVTAKEEMILTWHRVKCDNIEQIPSTRIFCSQLAEENLLNWIFKKSIPKKQKQPSTNDDDDVDVVCLQEADTMLQQKRWWRLIFSLCTTAEEWDRRCSKRENTTSHSRKSHEPSPLAAELNIQEINSAEG